MTAATKEITRDGFDLVMVHEFDAWVCSIYKTGKQIPLFRKSFKDEAKALAWFNTQIQKASK